MSALKDKQHLYLQHAFGKYDSSIVDEILRFKALLTFRELKILNRKPMRKSAFVLLIMAFAINCFGQKPSINVSCYSQKQWDSLTAAKASLLTKYNSTLTQVSTLKTQNATLTTQVLQLSQQVIKLNKQVDSLSKVRACVYDVDTLLLITDTAYFRFAGKLVVKVNLQGEYAKLTIEDLKKNRIYLTKKDNDLDLWVQQDLFTRYSSHLDLR